MTLPPDPFAGDPDDPARELAALDETVREPLVPADREHLLADLQDVEVFEALLAPRGIKGLMALCDDCDAPHYLSWDLLRADLRSLLDAGTVGAHEPAHEPDPGDYVSWDYARGFVDASLEG